MVCDVVCGCLTNWRVSAPPLATARVALATVSAWSTPATAAAPTVLTAIEHRASGTWRRCRWWWCWTRSWTRRWSWTKSRPGRWSGRWWTRRWRRRRSTCGDAEVGTTTALHACENLTYPSPVERIEMLLAGRCFVRFTHQAPWASCAAFPHCSWTVMAPDVMVQLVSKGIPIIIHRNTSVSCAACLGKTGTAYKGNSPSFGFGT